MQLVSCWQRFMASSSRESPRPGSSSVFRSQAQTPQPCSSTRFYVPESCASGEACGLHVALHGCLQSTEYIGDAFAAGAGYNEWAEANRLLVLYPQVASSRIAPLNPMGCWDWWGYTQGDYATKAGPQVKVIKATMDTLAGHSLQ